MNEIDRPTFDASPCEGICKGTCVMLIDSKIVYAGPLRGSPDADGKTVLLNSVDYEWLRSLATKRPQ